MGIFKNPKGKIKVIKGILYRVGRAGNRINFSSLDDALQYLAKCCGVDCCNQVLTLTDHTTGDLMVGYFDGGSWVTDTRENFLNSLD